MWAPNRYPFLMPILVVFLASCGQATAAMQSEPCHLDAQLCPDGSTVGRTGPSCGFAKCPGEDQPYAWTRFKDAQRRVEFEYPLRLGTWYITAQSWPPVVEMISGTFTCAQPQRGSGPKQRTESRSFGDRTYCVATHDESVVDVVQTRYTYTTAAAEGKLLTVAFTMRYPSCANVDERYRSECEKERQAFSVDRLVQRVVESARPLQTPMHTLD